MFALMSQPDAWASLFVLTLMEIVLGIDNIVFITVLCARLPRDQQLSARRIGLAIALVSRIVLLLAISWIMHLDEPFFELIKPWSGRDLILLGGGLFLLYKATQEIYENVEHPEDSHDAPAGTRQTTFFKVLAQIIVLDMVFSLDSVITAVGMADHIPIMVAAILIAVVVMIIFAGPVGDFIAYNPSVRILALAFLMLIGSVLIMEGCGQHISKGYIYAAMAFSLMVQALNMRRDHRVQSSGVAPGSETE